MPMAKSLLLCFILTITTFLLFVCGPVKSCSHGEIRLVEVTGAFNGTPEVCVAGRWSGVCADISAMNQAAAIVCKQLGCGHGYVDNQRQCHNSTLKFQCRGGESNLTGCSILDGADCSTGEDMCIVTLCTSCQAQLDLLAYGSPDYDQQVPMLDDGSSEAVVIQPFPFFGENQSKLFVNTNGVLSFHEGYIYYSPRPLPFTDVTPLIIPFLRDIHISCNGSGEIYYRAVNGSGSYQASLLVNDYVYRETRFFPTSIFIATWHQVYLYPCSSGMHQQNTFQVVLMTNGQDSFACFLYEDIQWGPGAQIGFNAGDGNRSFTVPGGLTGATLHMESLSNVGRPGLFVYQVDGDEIGAPASSPTQLIVTQVFQMSLQLRWTNTHDDEVNHFNVYCYHTSCPYCSHLPAVHTVTTSSTTATVTGMTPYTEYGCCVTAVNLNQESNCSEELNISTLLLPVPPTRPVDVGINEITSISFKLEWSRPLHIDGTLLYYQIRCLQNLNNVWLSTTLNSSVDVSNLQPFTNYTCCISATNQAGEGRSACSDARTDLADLQVSSSQINFVIALSAGALSAFLVVLALVITCITCCCCYKRRTSKQVTLQGQQSTVDPVYDVPEDIELKEKGSPQSNNTSHRHVQYKEEVDIRYENSANKKQREKKPMMPIATPPITQPGQQNSEKIYQPLIPPKTYKKQEVSAYQDLAFATRDAGTDVANNSEGQYEPIRNNDEDNQYELLSFGGGGTSQEGAYQLSFQREDDNTYETIQPPVNEN
ncbi:uncharacterized protein LOC135340507 isoform X2 [Halichondria panicea]|uniref:uncharacterized protein LOC135340507 isoform X2 n=1 Tax=Halichondria panicea TaxID=6063 RepID=UPI00312B711A